MNLCQGFTVLYCVQIYIFSSITFLIIFTFFNMQEKKSKNPAILPDFQFFVKGPETK
jgi:hypothetical protein